ncbi:unnamed protein product [Schistosoma rodhaini]|uniref:receptor protein-tyrosine kinase n=1 Tax=Schistosoma rodhaini TaxID=6188 RepID=A0AA85F8K5_9TREM|nr:unnamed protein product [Schistosoma rodhaini]CAH8486003.1 unnamed protein product [Schistosoma rodhaini]
MFMRMSFIGTSVAYCFLMMGLNYAFGLECKSQSMYEIRTLHCACDAPNIFWTLNSSQIIKKPGKFLHSKNVLQVFDFRSEDSGVYKCFDPSNVSKECSSVCLKADDPDLYYKAIHEDSIPDVEAEEQERPYWHQKMKAIPEFYEFAVKPLKLACYFYVKNSSVIPLVHWNMPSGHDDLIVIYSKLAEFSCSSVPETQRNLSGSCYSTEITIVSISGSDSFDCIIRTSNHSDIALTNSFTVLQKLTDILFPYSSDTEFEAPNFELIDELRLPNEISSGDVHSDLFSVTNKKSSLDLSTLILTNYTEFRFYSSDNATCVSKEVILVCHVPRTISQLEVWYLGQYDKHPRLLKDSKVSDSFTNNEKRYVLFDNSITLKLENLSYRDSGLYICKNDFFYKNVTITVMDCSKSNFISTFLPPILIWIIIFITISTIPLLLIYCIQIRRKSMQTVLSIPIDFLDKHAKSKRVDVFRKINLLYTNTEHKLLLHHSGSSASSSPTSSSSSSPLSPCTIYSRSSSSNISSTDTDIKLKITNILTSFSQRLLCQPSKYFPQNHNILRCNVMLLQWLNQYLNSDSKTYIPKSSFTLENLLGEGNYGIVYKGKLSINADDESNTNNTEIAIKTLKDGFRNRQLINLLREAKVLSELEPHPHIIRFHGLCIDNNHPYILLELAIHGNLRDFLRSRRPPGINFWADERTINSSYVVVTNSNDLKEILSDDAIRQQRVELLKFALDIADALLYFETLSLFHRDVAARNVVVTEGFVAKLCDFGYACTQEESDNGYMEMDKGYLAVRWMAPECLTTTKRYTSKCDVWSYGILLWELFSLGNSPYPGLDNGQLVSWINNGNRNTRPYLSTNSIYQLMLECWSQDPENRPRFYDICNRIAEMKSSYGDLKENNDSMKGYVDLMLKHEDYLEPRQYLH